MGSNNDVPVSNQALEFKTNISDMDVALVDEERLRNGENLSQKQFEIINSKPPPVDRFQSNNRRQTQNNAAPVAAAGGMGLGQSMRNNSVQ
jgi:hypothetical protein